MAKKKKTNNSVKDFIFEVNKKYKFDWCIITKNNEVILYNKEYYDFHPFDGTALIKVETWIDENCLLHIIGDLLIWEIALHKTNIKDLPIAPAKKYIKTDKGLKWLGIKPYEYVHGWYCLSEQKETNIIMKNYKIKIDK